MGIVNIIIPSISKAVTLLVCVLLGGLRVVGLFGKYSE